MMNVISDVTVSLATNRCKCALSLPIIVGESECAQANRMIRKYNEIANFIIENNNSMNIQEAINWREHISTDPTIMFGKMVIKGTRIPVEIILEKLASGFSFEGLKEAYPRISTQDIQACLLYAADNIKHEKTLAVA